MTSSSMTAPNRVKALAVRLRFTVSDYQVNGNNGMYLLRATPTAAPVEVYFRRERFDSAWLWSGAVHRVHWSDPISKANEGQPELATFTAFKAYLSLLSVTLK